MQFSTCMGLFLKEPLCDDHFRQIRDHGIDVVELGVYPGHSHATDGKEDQYKPPFSGTIDWEGVLQGLKAGGYTGPLTYETLSGSLADIAVLNDRLSELWEETG